jgi:glycosyltransferase involved in cell wall biosynthesis
MLNGSGMSSAAVSIAIPAFNAAPFLGATIESVLAQSFQDWQLVVVDNASTDETGDIAASYDDPRISIVTNDETLALVDNWNRAVAATNAPLVKLLCADDLLRPDCLALQVPLLDARPEVSLVSGRRGVIGVDGDRILDHRGLIGMIGDVPSAEAGRVMVSSGVNQIGWPGPALFRRNDYDAVGGFTADYPLILDWHFWFKLLHRGDFVGQAAVVADFRISPRAGSATAYAARHQARSLLIDVAADSYWGVTSSQLSAGKRHSRVEELKRRLLYRSERPQARGLRLARRFATRFLSADRTVGQPSPTSPRVTR